LTLEGKKEDLFGLLPAKSKEENPGIQKRE
jgi:hypothetical protein